MAISIIGGCTGALLLLNTSDIVFAGSIPHLMLFATALFAFGSNLIARIKGDGRLGLVAATAVGGVVGGHYSTRTKNTSYLRVFIMLVGLSLSVIFFIQNYF